MKRFHFTIISRSRIKRAFLRRFTLIGEPFCLFFQSLNKRFHFTFVSRSRMKRSFLCRFSSMRELFCLFFQSLNNLLSVLSAFPAVFEVLADAHRPSTSGSEVEETITSREGYFPPECIMVRTLATSHSSLVRLLIPPRRPNLPLPLYQRIRVLS